MSASASEGTLVDEKTGTRIAEVSHGIFRVSAPIGAGKDLLDTPIATPFTNNLYVIKAEKPALYLTGFKQGFPALKKAVSSVVDVKSIRYIVLTLWARDQMGALRLWLDECPDAVLVCSKGMLATRAEPKGITRVKPMSHGEILDLGSGKSLEWMDTPNMFNGAPECGFIYERSTRTLFTGDLFSHNTLPPSALIPSTLLLDPSKQFDFDFSDPRCAGYFEMLISKAPKTVATMHGGACNEDGVVGVMQKWSGMHMERQAAKPKMQEMQAKM